MDARARRALTGTAVLAAGAGVVVVGLRAHRRGGEVATESVVVPAEASVQATDNLLLSVVEASVVRASRGVRDLLRYLRRIVAVKEGIVSVKEALEDADAFDAIRGLLDLLEALRSLFSRKLRLRGPGPAVAGGT